MSANNDRARPLAWDGLDVDSSGDEVSIPFQRVKGVKDRTTTGPAVTGVVRIDVRPHAHRGLSDCGADSALQQAIWAPPGASVVIVAASEQLPPVIGIRYLRDHGQHLGSITVECEDAVTIAAWVAAFRRGLLVGDCP